jgi:hypothetical protein
MSQRMKVNQHINTMASLPGEAGDITCAKACSRSCACKGFPSTDNGYTRLLIIHPLPAAEQSSDLENATNQPAESRIGRCI